MELIIAVSATKDINLSLNSDRRRSEHIQSVGNLIRLSVYSDSFGFQFNTISSLGDALGIHCSREISLYTMGPYMYIEDNHIFRLGFPG